MQVVYHTAASTTFKASNHKIGSPHSFDQLPCWFVCQRQADRQRNRQTERERERQKKRACRTSPVFLLRELTGYIYNHHCSNPKFLGDSARPWHAEAQMLVTVCFEIWLMWWDRAYWPTITLKCFQLLEGAQSHTQFALTPIHQLEGITSPSSSGPRSISFQWPKRYNGCIPCRSSMVISTPRASKKAGKATWRTKSS